MDRGAAMSDEASRVKRVADSFADGQDNRGFYLHPEFQQLGHIIVQGKMVFYKSESATESESET